jgi:hypothetical protein
MSIAYKFNNLVTAHFDSLDPTKNLFHACMDNNDETVTTSNCLSNSRHGQLPKLQPLFIHLLTATARTLFVNPLADYLNALTITLHQAIADTGATSIFIMDGVDVVNNRISPKPLTINMPQGRKVKSTHICDITIPGLPVILTGHIVLHLTIASLIGI